MPQSLSRRTVVQLGSLALPVSAAVTASGPPEASLPSTFPSQPPELVHEMVTVSHFSMQRVRELVEARPTLAKAVWDWGFGDWESALGAASHVGNREIADYLILHGARPSLFSAAMLGQLGVVKAFIAAQPGAQKIPGPHSIPLLAHARAGGAAAEPVLRYLESLGDAGAPPLAPLTDAEMTALSGVYGFGQGAKDRIEVTVVQNQLQFTRLGTTPRGLFHLGDHVFHPAGASAVRIRFAGDMLTVFDPDLVLSARRIG